MKLTITIQLLFLICPYVFAQNTMVDAWEQKVNPNHIKPWNTSTVSAYEGVYKFGYSEWESSVYIFVDKGKLSGQLCYGRWIEKEKKSPERHLFYIPISETQLVDNEFVSEGWQGRFVLYKNEYALVLNNTQSGCTYRLKNEVGTKYKKPLDQYFQGKFAQASYQKLTKQDLASFSKEELAQMRNEIFARYGHHFKKGGKMDAYFSEQSWYKPRLNPSPTISFLSSIELHNIALIQELEQE